jgi:uncharacterized protein (TIGR03382 family)
VAGAVRVIQTAGLGAILTIAGLLAVLRSRRHRSQG